MPAGKRLFGDVQEGWSGLQFKMAWSDLARPSFSDFVSISLCDILLPCRCLSPSILAWPRLVPETIMSSNASVSWRAFLITSLFAIHISPIGAPQLLEQVFSITKEYSSRDRHICSQVIMPAVVAVAVFTIWPSAITRRNSVQSLMTN